MTNVMLDFGLYVDSQLGQLYFQTHADSQQ